jgi:hypothetical protein
VPAEIRQLPHFIFTNDILERLNYIPLRDDVVTNAHFVLMDFYLQHPFYDYYWFIEDDVRFTGNWSLLFDFFTRHPIQPDFISSLITTYQEAPVWNWWASLMHPVNQIPMYLRIRSFNPVMRISNAALSCIHNMLRDKWIGHHEALLPTVLHLEGFHIADFGGDGPFVLPGQKERFYVTESMSNNVGVGTMRFRPVIQPSEITKENKLYHPVKLWF